LSAYLSLFGRGFAIVALTAANIVQITRGRYVGAFLFGAGISYVWWLNAHSAAHSDLKYAQVTYALGAGCGTVCGMLAGGLV
jgi:hypothetical protein